MSSRSFTVFQDAPSSEVSRAKPASSHVMATRSSTRSQNVSQSTSTLNDIPTDKENVHPVTGERAGANGTSKKRKTNVLAAKPAASLAVKKAKSSKEDKVSQPDRKKRKATSEPAKPKTVAKKRDGKAVGTSRKLAARRVARRISPLPHLEEEVEDDKNQAVEGTTQATIDSRCYELTVQPLADVTQAYDAAEPVKENPSPSKIKFCKDTSAEPEIRDFFSPSDEFLPLPSTSTLRASSAGPLGNRKFSTPERKQIYAAFTFSTPSPASERFSKSSSRSVSVPHLQLA